MSPRTLFDRATLGGYRLLFRLPFASRSRFYGLRHVPDLGPACANASLSRFRIGIHGRLALSIGDKNNSNRAKLKADPTTLFFRIRKVDFVVLFIGVYSCPFVVTK